MSGLIGALIAGGVKGTAESRVDSLNRQEEFNMKQQLLNAEVEKQLMLKKAGYAIEDKREQDKKDRIKSITSSVSDDKENAGGYESDADKSKRERDLTQKRADKLADEGEYDAAGVYYKRADAYDKTELSKAQLEAKQKQIEGQITNAQERLRLQGESVRLQGEANIAKAEAAAARASNGANKKTQDESDYDSYVQEMKNQGKEPLPKYRFNNWQKAKNKEKDNAETVAVKTDEFGNKETTVTRKGKPSKSPAAKVGRYVAGKGIVYD